MKDTKFGIVFVPGGDVNVSFGRWGRNACLNFQGDDWLNYSAHGGIGGGPRQLCPITSGCSVLHTGGQLIPTAEGCGEDGSQAQRARPGHKRPPSSPQRTRAPSTPARFPPFLFP